jgi:hypothetical protein
MIHHRFFIWCPRFARVGAPNEARLVGVTGLTWGSCFFGLIKTPALNYYCRG